MIQGGTSKKGFGNNKSTNPEGFSKYLLRIETFMNPGFTNENGNLFSEK